jgi:5'(3')-deoxyribonucleotidase
MELTRSEFEYVAQMLKRKDRIGHLVQFYPQAQSFIEHLGFSNKVVFTTAPWRGLDHWVEARYGLLDHFLNRRNYSIVFTADKEVIAGDWIIDDRFENMNTTPERGILFLRPWNLKFENFAAFVAKDYTDVIEIIERPVEMPDASSAIPQAVSRVQKKPAREKTASAKR